MGTVHPLVNVVKMDQNQFERSIVGAAFWLSWALASSPASAMGQPSSYFSQFQPRWAFCHSQLTRITNESA